MTTPCKCTIIYGPLHDCGCTAGRNNLDGEPQRQVTLVFLRSELLYDIANMAYVEGDILAEEAQCLRHQVQDVAEDGNVDRVTRVLDLVHAKVEEDLYPFTQEAVEDGLELDDTLTEQEKYLITLNVPVDFSKTTANYLVRLIHELLVCRALYDWLSATGKDDSAAKWLGKYKEAEEEIQTALTIRMGRVHRPMRPW